MGSGFSATVEAEKVWEGGKRSFLSNFDIDMRRDISSGEEQNNSVGWNRVFVWVYVTLNIFFINFGILGILYFYLTISDYFYIFKLS